VSLNWTGRIGKWEMLKKMATLTLTGVLVCESYNGMCSVVSRLF